MAGIKSLGQQQIVIFLLVSVLLMASLSQSQLQSCSTQLGNLNGCAPFVLPGATNPSPECCGALGAVQQDCLCSTLRIASTLPSLCHLPPLSCGQFSLFFYSFSSKWAVFNEGFCFFNFVFQVPTRKKANERYNK